MDLQEKLVLNGEWFLPENEQERLSGRLIYDPEYGIRLEVHGVFGNKSYPSYFREHQIINGWVEGEKYVTLLSAFLKTPNTVSTYIVSYFFYDIKVNSFDFLQFNQINIRFSNLEEWVGISGFKMRSAEDLFNEVEHKEVKVFYKLPQPITYPIQSGKLSFSIDFTCTTPIWKIVTTEQSIKQITTFQLKSQQEINFLDLLKYADYIGNLFSFGIYQYPVINSVEFVVDDFVVPYFAVQSFMPHSKEKLIPQQMLFTYSSIHENMPFILDKWFRLCDKLGGILNLVVEQFVETGGSHVNSFLNLAQAAESIHSKLYNHPKNNPTTFRKLIEELISYIPDEHKDFVRNKISRNDLTLADRIKELLKQCSCLCRVHRP